jgi:predicted nucleic acid-binding protein
MKYVLDSSVAVKWRLPEVHSDKAQRLRDAYQQAVHELIAPDIFPAEVAHALTRAERQLRISVGDALALWTDIMNSGPQLLLTYPLYPRAIAISSNARIGVYDCLYVALAEREGCQLVTADTRLVSNLQPQFPFVVDLVSMP